MGLIDYSNLVATTKISDGTTGQAPGGETIIIGWIMSCVSFPIIIFMGLFLCEFIGLIAPVVIIGLAIWACGYYGTNRSLWARFRYRTTKRQRMIIGRRLSEYTIRRRLSGSH